ncbi:hydroxyacylglutathione hydrolase [Buchnera aphidicola (Hyadaphis tataricae)]|uniref:Hydroxyacylglutathione hydrolase n=1 Tax=Buchnera aphidicola (Hyadaphis tataricae) TaxID=1241859 RepID=A0A4D6XYE7_9GAMM|nr:hydroxyacylglutathione hydrolase [Buchnera aphidicola]QCI21553.1 hydroxyacylglutathione hydrolase [Buchnera aphidicola (Hyadaphis tataricae)]
MILNKITILKDNYVWILNDSNNNCIIIDPGLSYPVFKQLEKKQLFPVAILLTHNHIDHIGGVKDIKKKFPKIMIFGSNKTKQNCVNKIVKHCEILNILDKKFYVFYTPGHTKYDVTYYHRPYIFCGDTVFSGGCGRVYKMQYVQMYNSIKLISSFPNESMICCAHEYTLSNLEFSLSILQEGCIKDDYKKIKALLMHGSLPLPSSILFEKSFNLFFRLNENFLKELIGLDQYSSDLDAFIKLRLKKDLFGAKRD